MNPHRCLLFVPGNRSDRFDKALAADPDQLCIDLEDAVPADEKAESLDAALAWLGQVGHTRTELGLRINEPRSDQGQLDLKALAASNSAARFVMLPKVESEQDIGAVRDVLGDRTPDLIAQLESPHAVFEARRLAIADQRLSALMFGGYDYALSARAQPCWDSFYWPRASIAAAAAEAGVDALDVPSLEVRDLAAVGVETERVIALGYTGRAAIHPAQVPVIQQAYLPDAVQAAHAKAVVEAARRANGAPVQVNGKLVDRPLELAAERTLALAAIGVRPARVSA